MKLKTIFASAAIVATMAAQNAQLVSAVTTDADHSSEKPLDVNNDVTGNQTSDSVDNTDGDSTVNNNDNAVVADPSDDSKTSNDTTNEKPVVPNVKVESTGSLGPGFYDRSTINTATALTKTATTRNAVTTALQVMPINVNTSAFINKISAGAISGWAKYKVLPSVTMAQAILESGWGASTLTTKANNLFGIKGRYNGQYVVMKTQEQDSHGNIYTVNAEFRKYPSQKESMEDHGNFLTVNSRYRNLIGKTNYQEVTRLLQQDGYATAVNYASSLNRIIETYSLTKYDNQAFNGGNSNGNNGGGNSVVGTPTSGTRYISNINGAAIYSAPNGKTTGRVLSFGTNWKIDRVYTSNNITWYRVGANMWVKGSDVSTGKPSNPNTNKPNSDKPAPKAISGIRYVKNTKGTTLYNSPYSDKKSLNRTLGYKTAWRVDQVVTVSGQVWYRVGKNQWVNNADLSTTKPTTPNKPNNPSKPNNPIPRNIRGVKYIENTQGGKLYNSPFAGKKYLGRTLAYKTAWKVDQVVTVSGQTWYRVGSGMWINNADLTAKPTEKVVKTVKTVKSTAGARVYKNHDTNTASNRVLKKNTAWKVDREFTSGGQLWYRVGSGAWVRSSDMK